MFKRKRKKVVVASKRLRFIKFIAGGIVICLLLGAGFFLYRLYKFRTAFYVSPLAKSGQKIQQSGSIEQELQNAHLQYANVAYTPSSAIVVFKNNTTAIFSLSKNMSAQIATLQLISTRLTIEGKKFTKVDFTFDKPVITF